MAYQYHTPEEESAIRAQDNYQLGKANNRGITAALVYADPQQKAKYEEARSIVRDELFQRGFLETADTVRLVSGKELGLT